VISTIADESFLAYPARCTIKNLSADQLELAMGEATAPEGFALVGQERIDELFRSRASVARSVLSAGAIPLMSGAGGGDGRGQLILLGAVVVMHTLNQMEQGFKAEKQDSLAIPPAGSQTLHLVLESKETNKKAIKPPPALTLCFVKPAPTCSSIELVDPFADRRRP
jgi:hypothetical protein